jgi:hypothetical protein
MGEVGAPLLTLIVVISEPNKRIRVVPCCLFFLLIVRSIISSPNKHIVLAGQALLPLSFCCSEHHVVTKHEDKTLGLHHLVLVASEIDSWLYSAPYLHADGLCGSGLSGKGENGKLL